MLILALATTLAAPPHQVGLEATRDARRALRSDDFEGARLHAQRALQSPGAHDQEAAWLLGLTYAYTDDPHRALVHFDDALNRQPLGAFVEDVRLSTAEAQADSGDYRAALRTLRRTRRARLRSETPMRLGVVERLELDRAMWRLEVGRLRPTTRRLLAALDAIDHDLATWQQSKARTRLASMWLDFADELGAHDNLATRALLVTRAREQLDETVELGHDRFILAQLHRLGTSFERLGDDVVTRFGSFADLPADDRQKVENVWVKARSFYDLAKRHAVRVQRTDEAYRYGQDASFVEQKVDQLTAATSS